MAPPQETAGGGAATAVAAFRVTPVYQTSEPKRMRIGSGGGGSARSVGNNSTKFTRAATGSPAAMTNKGSVYKAQRGKAVTAAMVKAKTPTTHRRRGRKGKSVYRGVCVTREGKWRAVIYKERKQLYLGVYESEVDAAKAHDRAARFHFAENAVCNFDSEHEADRQVLLHKQRQLVQQHEVAAHQIALHNGGFVAGREEFDDLEEYHRGLGMDGGSCSEEGEGMDGEGEGDTAEEDMAEGDDDLSTFGETRSSRSLSTSSATSVSTGSMISADDAPATSENMNQEEPAVIGSGQVLSFQSRCHVRGATPVGSALANTSGLAAVAASGVFGGSVGAGLQQDESVSTNARMGGSAHNHHHHHHQLDVGAGSAGESDDSDFTPSFLQDVEPRPLEGMGFPYAEDLLGYEMQSWYSCQDDCLSTIPSGSGFGASLTTHQQQHPFMGLQQQQSAVERGMGVGWGITEFGPTSRQSSSSSMSSSLSGFSSSCDEDYVPSALPPLMGMSADP